MLKIADQGVDLEYGRLEGLAAAEGEELIRQVGGAIRGVVDFPDLTRERSAHVVFGENQIAVTKDGGEEIIEVVSDAAGELTKCLHPLGATGFVEQLPARGYVHH